MGYFNQGNLQGYAKRISIEQNITDEGLFENNNFIEKGYDVDKE